MIKAHFSEQIVIPNRKARLGIVIRGYSPMTLPAKSKSCGGDNIGEGHVGALHPGDCDPCTWGLRCSFLKKQYSSIVLLHTFSILYENGSDMRSTITLSSAQIRNCKISGVLLFSRSVDASVPATMKSFSINPSALCVAKSSVRGTSNRERMRLRVLKINASFRGPDGPSDRRDGQRKKGERRVGLKDKARRNQGITSLLSSCSLPADKFCAEGDFLDAIADVVPSLA